ncbi:MAG: preprotein translocase subunit SecG [Candidatus Komeilibacteria bacterium]
MKDILYAVQIIISVLLIGAILLQNQASGLGNAFGGESVVYRTKRGAEKIIFRATIVLVVLFMLTTLASIFIY